MVVSGAPVKNNHHAQSICNMALDMQQCIKNIENPATNQPLETRMGGWHSRLSSGPCVVPRGGWVETAVVPLLMPLDASNKFVVQ